MRESLFMVCDLDNSFTLTITITPIFSISSPLYYSLFSLVTFYLSLSVFLSLPPFQLTQTPTFTLYLLFTNHIRYECIGTYLHSI